MLDKLILNGTVQTDEPMSSHTTFRIGGNAAYFACPQDESSLVEIMGECSKEGIPYFVMGNGSNLLVSDKGFDGMIICIRSRGKSPQFVGTQSGELVSADAGISLAYLAGQVAERGLEGFEFAAGIPGTVGGAVVMNAGAYGGEIKNVLKSVNVICGDGSRRELGASELELSYRHSIFMQEKYRACIITSAVFEFPFGRASEIREKILQQLKTRREKQPLEYPSAGSTFKRPEGHFAGKLIMDAGLAGFSIGGAQVSQKHCGFVINTGNATAEDVYRLITHVARAVYEKFGVVLEPEVKLLGEFE